MDTGRRRAHAGGGALLNTLDSRSLEHGLVTTAGVVSHTGVGGLTLGGGFGRLNRKYGLTIDNLVAADIVTADGRIRTVSEQRNPICSGRFAAAAGIRRRHPFRVSAPSVQRSSVVGDIVWPIEQARLCSTSTAIGTASLSDELYVGPAMLTMPEGNSVLAMEVVYNGIPRPAKRSWRRCAASASRSRTGSRRRTTWSCRPRMTVLRSRPRSYAKNGMVKEVTPAMVTAMVEAFGPIRARPS